MISATDLVAKVKTYNPKSNIALITQAYDYAMEAHQGQKRRSGEPYFLHPVAVAWQLADQQLDDATIITALLHDTLEDTPVTFDDISERFGTEIAKLVSGVTKLTEFHLNSTEAKQAENFRKLLFAMCEDLRVILVKLADRLHNMRTIRYLPAQKQVQKSRETMDIFAPLAGRMGMQWMRDELEDLAFQVLNPDARQSILKRFVKLRHNADDVIARIVEDIKYELAKVEIEAEVLGRAKRPYSIWRKMQDKNIGFSRLSDIYGFRVITQSEEECYKALWVIHKRWKIVPGRFKDYISQPKSNGYSSIHTTVSGRDGKQVEVQIRTKSMHEVAESGVAAHWAYRDGVRVENPHVVDPSFWLKSVTEDFDNTGSYDEFLEHVKLEMSSDKTFCFTPKGDVIQLPKGATPLDFAYRIHTRIGHSCVGAKVDGLRVPLWTRLKNGQSVEITTAEGQRPQSAWTDMVKTGRAKQAIKKALREDEMANYVKLGYELARVAFEQVGKKATDKALELAAEQLCIASVKTMLADIGTATLSARDVVTAIYPDLISQTSSDDLSPQQAIIGLQPGWSINRCNICQPVPGDRIVGIGHKGHGVEVHAIQCSRLLDYEDQSDRWIDLHWAPGHHMASHPVTIDLTISNAAGVLGRLCTLIADQGANISDLEFIQRKPDYFRILIDVDVSDQGHLHTVMTALKADTDVAGIERYHAHNTDSKADDIDKSGVIRGV